jgi:hypothetical protein
MPRVALEALEVQVVLEALEALARVVAQAVAP